MARYDKQHKDATRRRIVETSAHRIKSDGVTGSGVATLMSDAGLTNGAFYSHFTSKDDLVATVVAEQLEGQQRSTAEVLMSGPEGIEQLVRAYLSTSHRDHPGDGCPSAALLDEIGRCGDSVRRAYTDGVLGVIDVIAEWLDPQDSATSRVRALTVFAQMVGTLQMARAITDPTLSDALLEQGAANALADLHPSTP